MIGPTEIARWFDAHAAALVLYASQWLDRAAAEDVVQDVFVQLMAQRTPPEKLQAWLFRAVRNAAISHHRSATSRAGRETRVAGERPDAFESRPDDLIDAAAAQAALARLPADQREIIVMRIWGQMTLADAAEVTGEAVSTLFSRYKAGLSAVRHILESSCHATKKTP